VANDKDFKVKNGLTTGGNVKVPNGEAFMSENVAGSDRSLISLGIDNILRIKGNDSEGSNSVISMIAGGHVGIGTTAPGTTNLVVSDGGSTAAQADTVLLVRDSTAGSSTGQVEIQGGATGFSKLFFSDTAAYNSGGIAYDHTNDAMTFSTSGTTRMTLRNGNVGIGTTNPTYKLHVGGSGSSYLPGGIQLNSTDKITFGNPNQFITAVNNTSLTLATAGSASLTVLDNGDVGIGITLATADLHLNADATTTNAFQIEADTVTTGNVIDVANADALTTGGIADFVSNSADTGTRSLVKIHNDNAAAVNATALEIVQDSTGNALDVTGDTFVDGLLSINNAGLGAQSLNVFDSGVSGELAAFQHNNAAAGDRILAVRLGTVVAGAVDVLTVSGATSSGYLGSVVQQNGNGDAIGLHRVLGTGDAYSRYEINGGQAWAVGIDNSDSDSFKISGSSALGTNDYLIIDTSGNVQANSFEASNGYTVAGLPAGTVGQIARITDGDAALAHGATAVNSGAGATPYLVWYNGTNWTILGT